MMLIFHRSREFRHSELQSEVTASQSPLKVTKSDKLNFDLLKLDDDGVVLREECLYEQSFVLRTCSSLHRKWKFLV